MSDLHKSQNDSSLGAGDELNLKDIIDLIWDGKGIVLSIATFFFMSSLIYALTATHLWTSNSVLTIATDSTVGQNNGSKLGGIASMAGISLSGGTEEPDRGDVALATIGSRDFLKHLLEFEEVLPNLMAVKSYDHSSQKIIYDDNLYNPVDGWVGEKPSYLLALREYNSIVSTYISKGTGFLHISVIHQSPKFAYEFLNLIVREINYLSRKRDLEEAEQSLGFLYEQLELTPKLDIKLSINQLIESQMKTRMIANVKTNYLLEPLDRPYLPEQRTSPRRTFIVLAGSFIGLILGIIIALIKGYGFKKD